MLKNAIFQNSAKSHQIISTIDIFSILFTSPNFSNAFSLNLDEKIVPHQGDLNPGCIQRESNFEAYLVRINVTLRKVTVYQRQA